MGICICCCCNKKSTDYLENTLIVFTSIELVFLLLGLILIDWKIAASINLVLNIFIFLFLVFNLTALILFKFFREYGLLFTKYKKLSLIFAYLGMSFSILCIFLSILSESLISEKIYKYDHPCIYRFSGEFEDKDKEIDVDEIYSIPNNFKEENETIIKQICDSIPDRREYLDSLFWYNKRSSPKDIVMSYICSSIIEILSLIGAFIWYNDTRRIKYCIKNKMIEEKGIINYGPLGDYLGNNYNSNNVRIINDDIIYSRGNLNMNLNMRKKEKDKEKEKNSNMNISSVINSSISSEKKVVKNENTNVQNDEIIKEKGNESYVEEEKRDNGHKENSLYSADFY